MKKIINSLLSEKFSVYLIFSGMALIAFFTFTFLYKKLIFDFDTTIESEVFGQFGDIVGGIVGSVWSLAGVLLFYLSLKEQRKDIIVNHSSLLQQVEALNMQRDELALQRLEYQKTREVFMEQREVLKEQSKILKIQQFESNFYSLLNVYIKIRSEMDKRTENGNFFKSLNAIMLESYPAGETPQKRFQNSISSYNNLYYENKENLSHYFKTIYRIFKIIDTVNMDEIEKFFYAKIIRSQFAENELLFLYYNANTRYGESFYPLILKYNLLKHLPSMSKLEFSEFAIKKKDLAKRLFFLGWMDKFLEKHLSNYYDIECGEFYSRAEECDIVDGLIVQIQECSNMEIVFHYDQFIEASFLNLSELQFNQFVLSYLYDKLFFNQFIDLDEFDSIKTSFGELEEKSFIRFEIISQKTIKVNSDTF